MPERKLVITQDIDPEYIQQIQRIVPDWKVITGKDSSQWQSHLRDAEIIADWKKGVQEDCLDQDSKLKWLQVWSAGVNNLPLEDLAAKNIQLTSASGVHAYPISETIFALMLGLTRKIHSYVKNQQSKTWHHAGLKHEIHEKTVGIIGVGAIGKETAKLAKAFGMTVLGVRHSNKTEAFVDKMYTQEQLHDVLPQCDYVVVTVPLTKATYHLFGTEEFRRMKTTSFLINIGRGEAFNEEDLVAALREGEIAGAGLDVFETEPLSENSPLWEMDNVIITPHTAGSTEYYDQRVLEDIFIPNLKSYVEGKSPSINLVDYEKGY